VIARPTTAAQIIRHAYGRDYALADTQFAASFSSRRSDKIAIERVLPSETDNAPRWPPVPPPISPSHLIETATTRSPNLHKPTSLARGSAHAPHRCTPLIDRCTPLIDSPGAACPELAGADMQRLKVWSGFDPDRSSRLQLMLVHFCVSARALPPIAFHGRSHCKSAVRLR
jgi:hypothetical protein